SLFDVRTNLIDLRRVRNHHRGHGMRGVFIDELVDARVDDVENALAGLAGGDGFHDIIRAEHLAGDEGREGRSDLGLTLMEDALEGEGADLLRLLRLEDEAKGNPIRDISIEEAEDGKDP